ncbi:MAG: cytochrome b5-like heme/steroid binding domain-containing protein [Pseudohongiellaceae bacterium]
MKKLCYSAFIAFWASIATIMAFHVLAGHESNKDEASFDTDHYTLTDVAQHNSQDDCWMVIENKVFDITTYIERHPTPPSVLLPWCGKEATKGMRTKGYGNDHSPFAWNLLSNYQIGTIMTEQE